MARIQAKKGTNGKTRYYVTIRMKGHPMLSASFDRLTDAKVWVQQMEGDIRRGFDFRASFTRALQVGGIADFHRHDLRHTCASYLVMSGAALNTVASLLGHRTLAMTKRYSHLSDEFLRAEVEKMTSRLLTTTERKQS